MDDEVRLPSDGVWSGPAPYLDEEVWDAATEPATADQIAEIQRLVDEANKKVEVEISGADTLRHLSAEAGILRAERERLAAEAEQYRWTSDPKGLGLPSGRLEVSTELSEERAALLQEWWESAFNEDHHWDDAVPASELVQRSVQNDTTLVPTVRPAADTESFQRFADDVAAQASRSDRRIFGWLLLMLVVLGGWCSLIVVSTDRAVELDRFWWALGGIALISPALALFLTWIAGKIRAEVGWTPDE